MNILLTGAAGFIGMHVAQRLIALGHRVLALDNFVPYYNPALKRARQNQLVGLDGLQFLEADLSQPQDATWQQVRQFAPQRVVHLAAQPGVRYSIDHPATCLQHNITAFGTVLEWCRQLQVEHLVYASSSSVYGANVTMPYAPEQAVDHPVSLYAASKRANELMAHTYSHLFGLPTTGLRFFTVYGPWGRPDMAPWLFRAAIRAGRPIQVFKGGDMARDFTFVEDIAEGTVRVLDHPASPSTDTTRLNAPHTSTAPFRVHNIGHRQPVPLMDFIRGLEAALGKKAEIEYLPMQSGDVQRTWADTQTLEALTAYRADTPLNHGLTRWADWYLKQGHLYDTK